MTQGLYVLDLDRCIGCAACVVACNNSNPVGEGLSWRTVHTFNRQRHPSAPVFHYSLACNHCSKPACLLLCPAGAYDNKAFCQSSISVDDAVDPVAADLIFDPQTSGGLIISLPAEDAAPCLNALKDAGIDAAVIAEVVGDHPEGRIPGADDRLSGVESLEFALLDPDSHWLDRPELDALLHRPLDGDRHH